MQQYTARAEPRSAWADMTDDEEVNEVKELSDPKPQILDSPRP